MAEVETHSNGNGKHALEDDNVDSPVKAKLLKAENGDAVVKQAVAKTPNLKDDDTTADSAPAVDDEKSVGASNDSTGVIDVAALQAGDQSNNKSDFNESESGAVSTGGVGDESNTTNTNDLGITNSSANDLRNENTIESNGDDLVVTGGRRRVKEVSDNSADNYEDEDGDDEDDDEVGPGEEDEEEGGDDEDDDEVDEDEEDDEGEDDEEGEDGGEE